MPVTCPKCNTRDLEFHCKSSQCTWLKCTHCITVPFRSLVFDIRSLKKFKDRT